MEKEEIKVLHPFMNYYDIYECDMYGNYSTHPVLRFIPEQKIQDILNTLQEKIPKGVLVWYTPKKLEFK